MQQMVNHRTDGEIGGIFNHNVGNAVGYVPQELVDQKIINHRMEDAAPTTKQVISPEFSACAREDELARVLGLFRYPGRVLGSTNPGDIIQLHPDLEQEWDWICRHYGRAGVTHTEEVIWDDDFRRMEEFPGYAPSVFFFGSRAHAVRPDQKWFDMTGYMNSKNNFVQLCRQMNIRTPDTATYDTVEDFTMPKGVKYPVYLKVAVSVSGLGVMKCETASELAAQVSRIESGVAFQVQSEVPAVTFINLQYEATCKGLNRLAATEQILEGCSHAGNRYPSSYAPWKMMDGMAELMRKKGMKGVFAFDLAVMQNGKTDYCAIECNPRFNGSTYPTKIAQKLKATHWFAKGYKTTNNTFSGIDLGEIEYSPERGKGVIVVNWGSILDHKIGCLVVCSPKEETVYDEKLKAVI